MGDTVFLANIAEGTHEGGITKLTDAAITGTEVASTRARIVR